MPTPEETPKTEPKAPPKTEPRAKAPSTVHFVSREPEHSAFNFILGDTVVRGVWDNERKHVHWQVPAALEDAAERHHHVRTGRIVRA